MIPVTKKRQPKPPPPSPPSPSSPLLLRNLAGEMDLPSAPPIAATEEDHERRPRPLTKYSREAKKRNLELEDLELKVELKRQKIQTEKEAQETLRYTRQLMKELVDKSGNDSQAAKASKSLATIGNTVFENHQMLHSIFHDKSFF